MTEAQLVANYANAQLSTGPRTGEGKRRSSLNAFRQGLTGQIVIHTPEDQAAFRKHCDSLNMKPNTAVTTILPTTSRPNPNRLASFFRSPPSSAASSRTNASNRPGSSMRSGYLRSDEKEDDD